MMKMSLKKMVMMGLATVMVCSAVALAGCGGDSAAAGKEDSKNLQVITHANWNPFEYMDKGQIVGFDIDLMNAVAEEAGYKTDIKDVGWEAIFQQIQAKSADAAISGITATDERKQTFAFSVPYFISKTVILVPADSDITSAKDIETKGKTISVQNGSTAQVALEKVLGKNNPNVKKTTIGDQMLLGGQVDGYVGDETTMLKLIQSHPDKQLKIVYDDDAFKPEYFSIMYPKDSKDVKDKFDAALKKVIDSGKYAEIYKKWFHQDVNTDELKQAIAADK